MGHETGRENPCYNNIIPCVPPLSSTHPLFPSKRRHVKLTQYQAGVNLLCASQQPNSTSSNDPVSTTDYLMKWETAIMAIFTTYLALTRISIPKEEIWKYIDSLPAYVPKPGSSVIIPCIPIFRMGYCRKCVFFFFGKKFSCSLEPNLFTVSHKEVSQYLCLWS